MDWITQRSGEGLLYLRFYWWCGQFFVLILIPAMYRFAGRWGLVYLCGREYAYDERHGWGQENPVSAVELIMMMRQDRELRAFRSLFDGPPMPDDDHYGHHYVTPLMDRNPNPWTDTVIPVIAVVPMLSKVNPFEVPKVADAQIPPDWLNLQTWQDPLSEHTGAWEDFEEVCINALPTREKVPA